jgi:CHAT domain-containing protein
MLSAIEHLETSHQQFVEIGKPYFAAATQVSKLIALSTLGRYDEAIDCGLQARQHFLACGDLQAVGKIEHNIGNLYFRRDRYHDAEVFHNAARERFLVLNDKKQLATVNNCLANTCALLHKFKKAEELYQQAVEQAETAGLPVTLAGIEGNIGTFALLQGRYDRALDYLERSRRRYAGLDMLEQSILAEHEIADAYLELSLAPEAAEIYRRIIPKLSGLGMRAEHARALALYGRTLILLNKVDEALSALAQSRELYAAERNEVGEAMVVLSQAQLHFAKSDFARASELVKGAEPALRASGSWQRLFLAQWLGGEAERSLGNVEKARTIFAQAISASELREQPQMAHRCYTSLGLISERLGQWLDAERYFKQAVTLIEEMRAPLPGDEFRRAFFSDKLVPYIALTRLCLLNSRTVEALAWVEAARSRALADALGGNLRLLTEPRDEFEAELLSEMETLGEELNYLYNQMNRRVRAGFSPGPAETVSLQQAQRQRESRMLEIARRLQHRSEGTRGRVELFDLEKLQQSLGTDVALVEYTSIDGELLAFVVSGEGVEVCRNLGTESEVATEVGRFRFQMDTLRHGSAAVRRHMPALVDRARNHLSSLYDRLIRPIEPLIGDRKLVFVPHHALHYLPFHALYDGNRYLIERTEILYAPSAFVLQQCLDRRAGNFSSALLIGVADEQTPRVHEEIAAIKRVFSEEESFLDEDATSGLVKEKSREADVLHLACHAQFRTDNPLFSGLKLGDGWFTVRDAYGLKLNGGLVTLSACETGVNEVAPGEELIGLARGFFSAGAASVVLSLWTVDDEATAHLMTNFYEALRESHLPAKSLRAAQMKMLKQVPHPFFWSSFALVGHW